MARLSSEHTGAMPAQNLAHQNPVIYLNTKYELKSKKDPQYGKNRSTERKFIEQGSAQADTPARR